MAEPNIGTKQYAVSLAAFIRAWGNVKVPKDQTAVQVAFKRAEASDLSWVPRTIDTEKIRLLVPSCRELQEVNGRRPFYLDCRTADDLLGVTHKTAVDASQLCRFVKGKGRLTTDSLDRIAMVLGLRLVQDPEE